MVMNMDLKNLRKLREEKGELQKDVATLLNMKQQQYQRYENGTVEISITLLNILADHYETSIDYIVGRTEERKPYKRKGEGK